MSLTSTNQISVSNNLGKNALTNGDFFFGASGGDDYGPTMDSGFYNGITPPVGGYTIYKEDSGNIYANVAYDDTQCIFFLNSYGADASNITDALTWAATQPNIAVRTSEYTLGDLPTGISFVIGASTFTGSNQGYHVTANGVNGFSNAGGSSLGDDSYVLYGPLGNVYTDAINASNAAGMDWTNYSYVWNVTWNDDSTSLVRLGVDNNDGQFIISPIDTTDTRWQSGDCNSNSLAGTFNFPATFSPYYPLTAVCGHTQWC